MTFKIKMLAAASVLAVPGIAAAQSLDPVGEAQGQIEAPVQSTLDSATPPVADHTVPDPIQEPVQDALPPAQEPIDTDTQADAQAEAGPVTAATAADVQAGAAIRDQSGEPVGTIESVSGETAVVSTGAVRAEIPISSFGKDSQGLVLAMTRSQLEAAAGARTPS